MPRWIGLALCLSFFVFADRASSAGLSMTHSDAEVLQAIETMYWIPLSGPNKRKVYVIAAPWCPICRKLSGRLAETPTDIEFRFILTAPKSSSERARVGRALIERTRDGLRTLYQKKGAATFEPSPPEKFADGYNDAIWTAIGGDLQRIAGTAIGFPTLVYMKNGRVHVQIGEPADLGALAKDVDETPQRPKAAPIQLLLSKPPTVQAVDPKIRYAKKNNVAIFAAPDPKAPRLATLPAGSGFMQKGVVEAQGKRWLAFQFTNGGSPSAFGRPNDFR